GVLDALGLSYRELSRINPALIYVSISAFGKDGPKAAYAESDLVVWAACGALYPHREAGRPPVRVSVPQAYLHAAADAAGAALIAHFIGLRTGRGQHVDISAQQSSAQATLSYVLSYAVGDPDFKMGAVRAMPSSDEKPPPPPPPTRPARVDQSISGSATGGSKWTVR